RLDEPGDASPLVGQAASFQLHMRPAGTDLDHAARFSALLLDAQLVGATTLPPLDGLVDVSLAGWAEPIEDRRSLRGRSGTIRNMTISTAEGAGVTITGPVALDEAGPGDAELSVTDRQPQALASILAELMPESRREIELAMTGLSAMGDTPTLPLRIESGEVRLGFLSLGEIPPL